MQGGDTTAVLAAGLPEIAGTTWIDSAGASVISGVFHNYKNKNLGLSGSGGNGGTVDFSAQRSNTIYGNANTVQPPALQLIPQIKY